MHACRSTLEDPTWALVAGASQGIGRAFAERVAADGMNCVLVSRSQGSLDELAADLAARHGVECVTLAADLSAPGGAQALLGSIDGREVGLFVHNVGADTIGVRFLDAPVEDWIELATLNVGTSIHLCHAFGSRMKARRKGGIILVGSGACYGGSGFTSVYSGAKAFEMAFAEGLWCELQPHQVDVLYCSLGPTDTPAFRDFLSRKNVPLFPGLAQPADVAEKVLERLPHGPVYNWGLDDDDAGRLPMSAAQRRERVLMVDAGSRRIYGD